MGFKDWFKRVTGAPEREVAPPVVEAFNTPDFRARVKYQREHPEQARPVKPRVERSERPAASSSGYRPVEDTSYYSTPTLHNGGYTSSTHSSSGCGSSSYSGSSDSSSSSSSSDSGGGGGGGGCD